MKTVSSPCKETYFEIFCVVSSGLSELWNWFCFEKGALGIQTIEDSIAESKFKIFFDKSSINIKSFDH